MHSENGFMIFLLWVNLFTSPGHDELHSLSKNIDANSIRFWMGFGDHYLNVFNVLRNIGMLSEKPVKTAEGLDNSLKSFKSSSSRSGSCSLLTQVTLVGI